MLDDKSYIIDPLTALCKVALLHFMPEKTRLAINHHILDIQKATYYQWFERTKNGDSRIDISNLNMPFVKAIKWYILDNDEQVEMDDELRNSIRTISSFAIKGLVKMQKYTYQGDLTINIVLQYLINMLRDALDNSWQEENIVKLNNADGILSDKIKYNFEPHTINSISKMLGDADKIMINIREKSFAAQNLPQLELDKVSKSQNDVDALVSCAHHLLINRDTVFEKIMKEANTKL